MHVTACVAGQEDVDVEVGEACRSLRALKEAIVEALPKLCAEGFDVSVGGRALDDDEGVVSLEDRKPFCRKCLEKYRKDKHTSLATCCYEHHREGDGQAPIWDFCTTHRLTRCGACVHDKNRPSLEHCCNRHHGCRGQRKITTMFAPKAPLTAGVDPNGRTTTDERVGEPPHTPIADPHG